MTAQSETAQTQLWARMEGIDAKIGRVEKVNTGVDDKFWEVSEEKVEPKTDNINIFCYHPHISGERKIKSIVKTIESDLDSAVKIIKSDLDSADSGQEDSTESEPDSDLSEEGEKNTLCCDPYETDQEREKWKVVQHRGRNTRLKDYQVLIPKYNTNSGVWRNAEDVYEKEQPGYVFSEHDWQCVPCHNINFERRLWCNNPNCGTLRGYRKRKSGDKTTLQYLSFATFGSTL